MTKPTLYLDIDGVLNAMPETSGSPYTRHSIDGFTIHLHTESADMVATLAEHYEIVWLTLWNDHAGPGIGVHVGLAEAPFLRTSWTRGEQLMRAEGYPRGLIEECLYAKTPILAEEADPDSRWVWIDDDHGPADHDYLVMHGFDPRNFRLLRTDPGVGLTWDTVREAVGLVEDLGTELAGIGGVSGRHTPGSAAGRAWAVGEEQRTAGIHGDEDTCPQCGGRLVPIVYGLPGEELGEAADRGEVILGGCQPDGAKRGCGSCGWEAYADRYRW
jgi:hypothetical protein